MREEIEYDYLVHRDSKVNIRRITRYYNDQDEKVGEQYHRQVIDVLTDDYSGLPAENHRVCEMLRKAVMDGDNEYEQIQEGLADADVISEGETAETEAAKKLTWLERLKLWMQS